MTKKLLISSILAIAAMLALFAQDRVVINLSGRGGKGAIAIPDFRGAGDAQRVMGTFNTTLWNEVDQSGLFRMIPKTMYPLNVPQRPTDFKPPVASAAPARRGAPPAAPVSQGPWLTDWSGPPVAPIILPSDTRRCRTTNWCCSDGFITSPKTICRTPRCWARSISEQWTMPAPEKWRRSSRPIS
jgi:hypothetical protein